MSSCGHVQAANLWCGKIAKTLMQDMGFSGSELDPCLFICHNCIMLFCVDDAILLSCNDKSLAKVLQELKDNGYLFNCDGNFT